MLCCRVVSRLSLFCRVVGGTNWKCVARHAVKLLWLLHAAEVNNAPDRLWCSCQQPENNRFMICDPKSHSDAEFDSSVKITSALVALIVQQELTFSIDTLEAQRSAKCEVVRMKHRAHDEVAATLCQSLPIGLQRIVALSSEKGASSWLSALPVEEHGFALHKGAFRDALCLRYGWLPSGLPTQCVCGQGVSVDHSMNCPTGGYPTLRHNELRDFTAAILSEVCTDVCVEPPLQSLSGETLTYATANREDGARLDV